MEQVQPVQSIPSQPPQTQTPAPAFSQPVPPVKITPLQTTLVVTFGLLLGLLMGSLYSGKWLLPTLLSFKKHPFLENDRIVPPGIGFNFLHNIRQLPKEVFTYSQQVTRLGVRGGRMGRLPVEIGSFVFLEILEISDNNLKSIPPQIGNLTALETLNLGGNKIKTLPSEIGDLTNLRKLYLYDNKLSSLPLEVGNLANLEILDLRFNSLTKLPASIGNFVNLQFLYLGGNKIPQNERQNIQNLLPNTTIFF